MTALLKGLVQIKDPLTLFAFVTLVLLAAFRTPGVAQLFLKQLFKLLGGLPPAEISMLLKRTLRYTFAAFALVCVIAGTGQVLAYTGRVRPYSVEDVQKELASNRVEAAQKQAAVDAYSKGLSSIDKGEFDHAIQSLQESIAAVPTLAAQYTLALAYAQKKDSANAAKFAEQALATATSQGDSAAILRAERLVKSSADSAEGEHAGMLGPADGFPAGGKSMEEATSISAGRYVWHEYLDSRVFRYFKVKLKPNQTLEIDFKTPDTPARSGYWGSGGASIYDSDGRLVTEDSILNGRSEKKTIHWQTAAAGWVYLSVGNSAGAGWPNDSNITYFIRVE